MERGSAWAHDCAVWDEEVAEDQDESCGHVEILLGLSQFPKRGLSEVECLTVACDVKVGLGSGGAIGSEVQKLPDGDLAA